MKSLFIISVLIVFSTSSTLFAQDPVLGKLLQRIMQDKPPMSIKKLKDLIDREKSVIVLDIREAEQKIDGYIYADESYAITRGNLEFLFPEEVENKNSVIVTYCRSGGRSILAAKALRDIGYKNATSLKGGMRAWAQAGYPIETGLGVAYLKKTEDE